MVKCCKYVPVQNGLVHTAVIQHIQHNDTMDIQVCLHNNAITNLCQLYIKLYNLSVY